MSESRDREADLIDGVMVPFWERPANGVVLIEMEEALSAATGLPVTVQIAPAGTHRIVVRVHDGQAIRRYLASQRYLPLASRRSKA